MQNLDPALAGKQLADLKKPDVAKGSNLIEPTKTEIETILTALKDGLSPQEIKKNIRRVETETRQRIAVRTIKDGEGKDVQEEYQEDYEYRLEAKGFSFNQIKKIDTARKTKIAELTPKPVEEVIV